MKIAKYCLFFLLTFLIFACGKFSRNQQDEFLFKITDYKLDKIRADTLNRAFLYESFSHSYIAGGDAWVKTGGFIKDDELDLDTYKDGYYLINYNLLSRFKKENPSIKFDSSSVVSFQNKVQEIFYMHSGYDSTEYNPYCGLFLRKFMIKAEVVKIGSHKHRTPVFLNCEDFKKYQRKNRGKNFEVHELPTFLITKVYSWEEIKK